MGEPRGYCDKCHQVHGLWGCPHDMRAACGDDTELYARLGPVMEKAVAKAHLSGIAEGLVAAARLLTERAKTSAFPGASDAYRAAASIILDLSPAQIAAQREGGDG